MLASSSDGDAKGKGDAVPAPVYLTSWAHSASPSVAGHCCHGGDGCPRSNQLGQKESVPSGGITHTRGRLALQWQQLGQENAIKEGNE